MSKWLEKIVRCVGDFCAKLDVIRLGLHYLCRYLERSVDSQHSQDAAIPGICSHAEGHIQRVAGEKGA